MIRLFTLALFCTLFVAACDGCDDSKTDPKLYPDFDGDGDGIVNKNDCNPSKRHDDGSDDATNCANCPNSPQAPAKCRTKPPDASGPEDAGPPDAGGEGEGEGEGDVGEGEGDVGEGEGEGDVGEGEGEGEGDDCPNDLWAPDTDGDGAYDLDALAFAIQGGCEAPVLPIPVAYVLVSDHNFDCDSTDSNVGEPPASYPDREPDGHGDKNATPSYTCDIPLGFVTNNDDCDDSDASVYPGAPEICDLQINDCRNRLPGVVADVNAIDRDPFFVDKDGDGHGAPGSGPVVLACLIDPPADPFPGIHYELLGDDCDDRNELRFTGAIEPCGGHADLNCDNVLPPACPVADAGVSDAGQPASDAGFVTDAGQPVTDAGQPVTDAGTTPTDAGQTVVDAGPSSPCALGLPGFAFDANHVCHQQSCGPNAVPDGNGGCDPITVTPTCNPNEHFDPQLNSCVLDAPPDAGTPDAGQPVSDAGQPISDAGQPATDAGQTTADAGVICNANEHFDPQLDSCVLDVVDAGVSDAGTPVSDAGQPVTDAGQPATDAGQAIVDAGPGNPCAQGLPGFAFDANHVCHQLSCGQNAVPDGNGGCTPVNGPTDAGQPDSGTTVDAGTPTCNPNEHFDPQLNSCVLDAPGGSPFAIVGNATNQPVVLEVDLTKAMPRCDAANGCSNPDPLVFQKSSVYLVDLTVNGCYSKNLVPESEQVPVNGKVRYDFSTLPLAGCIHKHMRFMVVSSVDDSGSGSPNPNFNFRNQGWQRMDLRFACDGANGFCAQDADDICLDDVGINQVFDANGAMTSITPLGTNDDVDPSCF